MTSFAATISDVLHQKTQLVETSDYQEARLRVSNFRYALLREGERLPELLQGKLPKEIEKQQESYRKLSIDCLEWGWKCDSHILNPNSEMGHREWTLAGLPKIQEKVNKFWESRKQFFPEDVLPKPNSKPRVAAVAEQGFKQALNSVPSRKFLEEFTAVTITGCESDDDGA